MAATTAGFQTGEGDLLKERTFDATPLVAAAVPVRCRAGEVVAPQRCE